MSVAGLEPSAPHGQALEKPWPLHSGDWEGNLVRSISRGVEQVEVVQTCDKIALSDPASKGRIQRRIQHHLGLLARRQLMKVAQELAASHIPRQMRCAEASKHSHVGLQ